MINIDELIVRILFFIETYIFIRLQNDRKNGGQQYFSIYQQF
jgi:hypothetical protein